MEKEKNFWRVVCTEDDPNSPYVRAWAGKRSSGSRVARMSNYEHLCLFKTKKAAELAAATMRKHTGPVNGWPVEEKYPLWIIPVRGDTYGYPKRVQAGTDILALENSDLFYVFTTKKEAEEDYDYFLTRKRIRQYH